MDLAGLQIVSCALRMLRMPTSSELDGAPFLVMARLEPHVGDAELRFLLPADGALRGRRSEERATAQS